MIARTNDSNCIRELVRDRHKYLMFYLDYLDNMCGDNWEMNDVVYNAGANLPHVISPIKSSKEIDPPLDCSPNK